MLNSSNIELVEALIRSNIKEYKRVESSNEIYPFCFYFGVFKAANDKVKSFNNLRSPLFFVFSKKDNNTIFAIDLSMFGYSQLIKFANLFIPIAKRISSDKLEIEEVRMLIEEQLGPIRNRVLKSYKIRDFIVLYRIDDDNVINFANSLKVIW